MLCYSLLLMAICLARTGGEWNKYMEDPSLYEGDMILNDEQKGVLHSYATTKRNGFYTHWPYRRPIPYEMDLKFERNYIQRNKLLAAMKDYENKTCLVFIPRTNKQTQKQFIRFVPGGGCSSYVGMQHSGNYIRLADGCFSHGTLLHEIAHSLGILHEQSRPDRDQYIKIHPENMKCCLSQFRMRDNKTIDSLGFDYDYESMMHYGPYAFGNGKGPTIEVLKKGKRIGQRNGFSKIDIAQINKMYKCGETITDPPKTTTPKSHGFCIKHATSGKYLLYGENRKLYFSNACHMKFRNIEYLSTRPNWCGDVQGRNNGDFILWGKNCKDRFKRTSSGKFFAIQHTSTLKCIHPEGGSAYPKDGTFAVIYSGCDDQRLKFLIEGTEIKTTISPSPTVPATGHLLVHVTSGKCLEVRGGLLVFSKTCATKFFLSGRLTEVKTGRCGYPESKDSNKPIKFLSNTCQDTFRETQISGTSFALQHVQTSKCIHPKYGSVNPKDGTLAVIWHSCDAGDRIKFRRA